MLEGKRRRRLAKIRVLSRNIQAVQRSLARSWRDPHVSARCRATIRDDRSDISSYRDEVRELDNDISQWLAYRVGIDRNLPADVINTIGDFIG